MKGKDGKVHVVMDITDWHDEAKKLKLTPKNDNDIVSAALDGKLMTSQIARAAIARRAAEESPDDVLKADKLLLLAGGVADVNRRIRSRKVEVELPNGKTVLVREAVGMGRLLGPDDKSPEDAVQSFVRCDTAEALRRANNYIINVIPGHVCERMKVVVAAGGDIEEAAEALKAEIDCIMDRLME